MFLGLPLDMENKKHLRFKKLVWLALPLTISPFLGSAYGLHAAVRVDLVRTVAQESVQGRVADKNGAALAGVTVVNISYTANDPDR